jgi:hypothetical protein
LLTLACRLDLPDIGVLAGNDPVAIDQAVIDRTGWKIGNLARTAYPDIDYSVKLDNGEKIGLGSRIISSSKQVLKLRFIFLQSKQDNPENYSR